MDNKLIKRVIFGLVLIFGGLTACQNVAETPAAREDERMVVFVSVVPQQYFVDRIGGEFVDAQVMVAAGASPATYEPKPSQMTALNDAVIYFSIGVAFENAWLDRISAANDEMLIVDSAKGIERLPMTIPHSHSDEEDSQHDDSAEGEMDPHVWLSPSLVKIQAINSYESLAAVDPVHQAQCEQNLNVFLADITALENELTATFAGVVNRKFMVFHPSWGYFAKDFNLEQIAIEVGGTEPSAAEMADLIEEAQEENISVVFAQPEFSTKNAETIAEAINGEVILISPLAYDWLDNLRLVSNTFAEVLNQE